MENTATKQQPAKEPTLTGSPTLACSLNLDLYAPEIDVEVTSMIAGKYKKVIQYTEIEHIAVLKAWLADDDLQAIKVCSTNIGFVRGYQKRFKRISENVTTEARHDCPAITPSSEALPPVAGSGSFEPLHPKRLRHPLEKALREAWESMEARHQDLIIAGPECAYHEIPNGTLYDANRLTGGYQPFPHGKMTDRDRMIGAEVMQWLGSPIGLNLLIRAFRKAGGKVEFDDYRQNDKTML